MNAGIDVSKGKSMVAIMRPLAKLFPHPLKLNTHPVTSIRL